MNRFPMCVDLKGKPVWLIGNGAQIRDKAEKLAPFGPLLIYKETVTEADDLSEPVLVIVGDTVLSEAERISALCTKHRLPVNVVDIPRLCSFLFPALITKGCLTVSVSTGGASPAAAAYLRRQIEQILPQQSERILDWICSQRPALRQRRILASAIAEAFARNRPLTEAELQSLEEATL